MQTKLKWKFYPLKKEGKYKRSHKITYHFNSFCISKCAVVGLYEALAIVVNGTNCHTQRKHITEVSVAFSSFQLDFWCNIVQIWLSHLRGFTRPRGNGEGILKVKKNNDLLNVCDSARIIWTMTWALDHLELYVLQKIRVISKQAYFLCLKKWVGKDPLLCWLPSRRQALHYRCICGVHCAQATKHRIKGISHWLWNPGYAKTEVSVGPT